MAVVVAAAARQQVVILVDRDGDQCSRQYFLRRHFLDCPHLDFFDLSLFDCYVAVVVSPYVDVGETRILRLGQDKIDPTSRV